MNSVHYTIKANVRKRYMIALVTDLHGRDGTDVISLLQEEKPDIIAIAGDLVDSSLQDNQSSIYFLKKCTKIGFTVFSLGNHDYHINSDDFAIIKDCGVQLLNDTWVRYSGSVFKTKI